MINRQLRSWVFMLYPDNQKHMNVINYIDPLDNSLYIRHVAKYDEKGEMINKEHFHCILKYDSPVWLSKVLSDLDLDDEDAHLFHSYTDFKIGRKNRFKSLNDYINYLDHVLEEDKPDKYSPDDFFGGLKSLALSIIASRDKEKYIIFRELCDFIKSYRLDHFPESIMYSFDDWFDICCKNGYGDIFYKEWFKMRDILRAYINTSNA